MHDDQLRSLLRALETDREPDPAFADALFNRLAFVAGDDRPARTPFLLLAAALLLTALAAGAALGSGLIRLPLTVEATASPSPSASDMAVASPSGSVMPSPSGSVMPGPSEASVQPSATPAPVVGGSVLFAIADGLRLRTEPSGSAEILATLRSGHLMGVVSGPTSADAMDWYEVRIGPGDTAGWVAAGLDDDWLALVNDGALLFRCDACATDGNVVTITPFGDADTRGIGGADLRDWTWAPDGSRIAATTSDDNEASIIVTDPDGSNRQVVGQGYGPSWSPDGSRLAWSNGDAIVVTDADLEPTTLELGSRSAGSPRWSPDGSLIAFSAIDCRACPPEPIVGDPPSATFVVAPDGSGLRQLTGGDYSGLAGWSPDGSMLSFLQVDLSGEFPTRAYLLPDVGGARVYLGDGEAVTGAPAWSPDGSRLVYAVIDGIIVADGQGGSPSVLVSGVDVGIQQVGWSPSGRWVFWGTLGASNGSGVDLWRVDAAGGDPVRMTVEEHASLQAAWQPILVPVR